MSNMDLVHPRTHRGFRFHDQAAVHRCIWHQACVTAQSVCKPQACKHCYGMSILPNLRDCLLQGPPEQRRLHWTFLLLPAGVAAFLGTWQVGRQQWKVEQVQQREAGLKACLHI